MVNKKVMLQIVSNALLTSGCVLSIGLFSAETPVVCASKSYPVHYALHTGHLLLAKALITLEPDLVNEIDNCGSSVLHIAICRRMPIQFIEWLLSMGAQNQHPKAYGSAIHTAALFEYTEYIPLLIAHGATVNQLTHLSETPLHHAYGKSIQILLSLGADIDAQDHVGNTPLHKQILSPTDAFILLMHQPNISLRNKKGETALEILICLINYQKKFYGNKGVCGALITLQKIIESISMPHISQCPICFNKKILTWWGLCGHQLCAECKSSWVHSGRSNGILCPFCRKPGIES